MSTQRRENRWQRTSCTERAGAIRANSVPGSDRAARVVQSPTVERPRRVIPAVVGHKLSAIGLPYRTACSYSVFCSSRPSPRFAALRGRPQRGNRHTSDSRVIPSAHPLPFRLRASPSDLAAGPGRQTPLGGKVRWQKRFVSPARRMKRGLQFLKTINSRRSTTNAKTSTPWQGRFTTAASPAFCPACSRHLWTWAWSATRSCM